MGTVASIHQHVAGGKRGDPQHQCSPALNVRISTNTKRMTDRAYGNIQSSICQGESRDLIIEKWESDRSLFDNDAHCTTPLVPLEL